LSAFLRYVADSQNKTNEQGLESVSF